MLDTEEKAPEETKADAEAEEAQRLEEEVENIAKICHDANRSYCQTIGDDTQVEWKDAPDWQKESARAGVRMHLTGDFRVEDSHESWMKQKVDGGWVHGETKDADAKTHPCIKAFSELPLEQQMKDHLFRGIVLAFKGALQ